MRRGRRTIGVWACAALGWCVAAPVAGQADEPTDAAVVEVEPSLDADGVTLAALTAPDYRTREQATRQLLTDDSRDLASLERLWGRAASLEARHRLLGVIRHRFLVEQAEAMFPAGGRGAIGVSHRTLGEITGPLTGAQVVTTLPGFPGHAFLRAGDVITAVEGRPLRAGEGVEVLSERVQQLEQGEDVRLTVWRGGNSREVTFRLGSMNALVAMYAGQALGEPFASRLAALERALWAAVEDDAGPDAPSPN
ncbi:MAG: hypothetical protein AAFY08_03645 [Planctomycetota bacterium]